MADVLASHYQRETIKRQNRARHLEKLSRMSDTRKEQQERKEGPNKYGECPYFSFYFS